MNIMKNPQNLTLIILLVTAAILGAVVVGTYSTEAYAEVSVKQGDYVMGTMAFSEARDLLYVIDIAARRLNTYTINTVSNAVEPVDMTVDLERSFGDR